MENQQLPPYIISSQPQITLLPGIGDLLSRSWQVYKERIFVFLGIMILPLLFGLLGAFILWVRKALPLYLFEQSLAIPLPLSIIIAYVFPVLGFITFLGLIIIMLWSGVALLYAIKEREQRIGIRESFAKGWPKIISFFWISLLVGFITLIGFLLFIIPGIIFSVWFSLATYVLVAENLTGMKALSRSKQLVRGYWWKVFWRLLAITIIGIAIYFPLAFIEELADIPEIASAVFWVLFTPFSITYSFLIYEDLRKLKEGVLV